MKNKKILSARLIFEGIRQTFLIGIIGVAVSVIYTVFLGFNFPSHLCNEEPEVQLYTYVDYAVMILTVLSFALFFYLFRFLNKRGSSDLFGSLSFSKNCILFSYSISVHFWLFFSAIAILATQMLCEIKYNGQIWFEKFDSNREVYIKLFLIFIATNLLLCAIHTIASSLSGTTLLAVIASVVILFLPQIILLTTVGVVKNMFGILNNDYFLSNPFVGKNVPVMYLLTQSNLLYRFTSITYRNAEFSDIIYTLLLSVIYFAIGTVLFNFRKSEKAGRGGSGALLVGTLGLTVSLLLISEKIFDWYLYNALDVDFSIIKNMLLVVSIVATVCAFSWTVINKGIRHFVKFSLTVLLIVVIDCVVVASMFIITNHELSFQPTADEIEKVEIMNYVMSPYAHDEYNEDGVSEYFSSDGMDYFISQISSDIKSYKNKELISKNIAEKSNSLKYTSFGSADDTTLFKIITKDGKVKYRNFCLMQYQDEIPFSIEELINNELNERIDEFKTKFAKLPDDDKISEFIDNTLSRNECKEVYDLLKAEIKNNPDLWAKEAVNFAENNRFDIWNYSNSTVKTSVDGTPYPLIKIRAEIDGKEQIIALPLFRTLPKSFSCYLNYYNKHTDNIKNEVLSKIRKFTESNDKAQESEKTKYNLYLYSNIYGEKYDVKDFSNLDKNEIKQIYDYLVLTKDKPIADEGYVLSIEYKKGNRSLTAYFAFDDAFKFDLYF